MKRKLTVVFMLFIIALPLFAGGQNEDTEADEQASSSNRGDLDQQFSDENGDLVADEPAETIDPDVLFFTYTPLEDPAVYVDMFQPFLDHLEEVTGKEVRYFSAQSYAAQIEAMRSGRLHIAGISTGPTPFAVNLAGYVPFSIMGTADGNYGYRLQTITHESTDITSLDDLSGMTVAHTEESSNSGNQAPRALLPEEGIVPGEDYEVVYSGGHGPSILGVYNQDYEVAHIASSVLDRMADRGEVEMEDLRVIYESQSFPTTSFGYVHNLDPELKSQIEEAFLTFEFEGTPLGEEFSDVDEFIEITYQDAWAPIRRIQNYNGVEYATENISE